jgi:gas vesicle protein
VNALSLNNQKGRLKHIKFNYKTNIMKTSYVILGVLGAATAGAILGVLFAPEKGSETRKKIVDKSKDYTNEFKDKFSKIASTLSSNGENLAEEVKNKFNSKINDPASEV